MLKYFKFNLILLNIRIRSRPANRSSSLLPRWRDLNHLNLNNLSKLNQRLMVGMSYLNRNLPLLGMDFRMALMDLSPPR